MLSIRTRLTFWICSLVLVACAAERKPGDLFGPSEAGTLVVDAQLLVGLRLPAMFVHQTLEPGAKYTRDLFAVRDAQVEITTGSEVFTYSADPDSMGRYLPPAGAPVVLPETEYRLLVRSGGREARAVTRTPERLVLRESVLLDEETLQVRRRLRSYSEGETVVFSAEENRITYLDGLVETRFDPIDVRAYQAGVFSLDPDSEQLLDADWLEEDDYEEILQREVSSPPYDAPDGKLRLPWFAVYYAGRHVIKIYALDVNWFDFARSSPEMQEQSGGFGGLAGENFERPIFHVDGGIGLFGSASVDSLGFVVIPRE
ncbi:MAG: DUF4249 family protein [Candidatus Latescibacteria bacterium]|nr:DUF4249 family protein [Candidatus Latescibacterota bacterium]